MNVARSICKPLQNVLPMEEKITSEISTPKEKVLTPKESTIEFLRLFARIYTCDMANNANKGIALN